MSNDNKAAEAKGGTALAEKVAAFKLIARNSLRMALISPRQARISAYEDTLASLAETKKQVELDLTVENYEIGTLDANHPLYEKKKAAKEETVKFLNERLESIAKQVEDTNKLITEQNEAIAKIESGETKVSKDELNALVDEMIRADAVGQATTCSVC